MALVVQYLPALMFVALVAALFSGLPVAFAVGGVGIGFATLGVGLDLFREAQFALIVNRIFGGVVENLVLVAVPMFVFMGAMLEVSGIAKDLLQTLQVLMRRVPGGLAVSVAVLGTVLAAATGIIGASVVLLTVLALPVMLRSGYAASLAGGTIAAAGTLGILIPPSIMLVVMGDLLSVSVGALFVAALMPGLVLAAGYAVYITVLCAFRPELAPQVDVGAVPPSTVALFGLILRSFLPVVFLISLVLGSIVGGWATPTEASGVGAVGATLLALSKGRLDYPTFRTAVTKTALTCAMLFLIFVGATAFSFVFRVLGGEHMVLGMLHASSLGAWGVLAVLMLLVFLLGFFFDWIEITLIVLPIFVPIVQVLDFGDHVAPGNVVYWVAILVAVNLQTSFLSPPFGFALFYVKGASEGAISTAQLYRGIIPFVLIQLAVLALAAAVPDLVLWLPTATGDLSAPPG